MDVMTTTWTIRQLRERKSLAKDEGVWKKQNSGSLMAMEQLLYISLWTFILETTLCLEQSQEDGSIGREGKKIDNNLPISSLKSSF